MHLNLAILELLAKFAKIRCTRKISVLQYAEDTVFCISSASVTAGDIFPVAVLLTIVIFDCALNQS